MVSQAAIANSRAEAAAPTGAVVGKRTTMPFVWVSGLASGQPEGCPRPLERRRRSTCPSADEARAQGAPHNDTPRAPVAVATYEPGGSLFGARTRVTERYACTVPTGGSGPRRYSMLSPVRIVAPGASTAW